MTNVIEFNRFQKNNKQRKYAKLKSLSWTDHLSEEDLASNLLEEETIQGHAFSERDPNFQSQLEYDGYRNIEEFDNDEYYFNVEGRHDDRTAELVFLGRSESEIDDVEEKLFDRQERTADDRPLKLI